MGTLEDRKRQLLERLAAEGKPTRLEDEELAVVRHLEADGLLFLVGLTAIVTPRLAACSPRKRRSRSAAPRHRVY